MVVTEIRHLKAGDAFPTLPDDKLTLISMRLCPYAHRVHLVLDAKQIPYHLVNVYIMDKKPEWLTTLNPRNQVPILRLFDEPDKRYLSESLAISDYLEEKYPQHPLYPKDPLAKEADQKFITFFAPITLIHYRAMQYKQLSDMEEFFAALDSIEAELVKRGTKYFCGTAPGMVDYMIWPWFERRNVYPFVIGEHAKWDPKRFPKMFEWSATMEEYPVVKNFWIPNEVHAVFAKDYFAGVADLDVLVKD